MSLPTLVYLGPAALCALSWLGLGSLVVGRHRSGDPLLDVLVRVGVGAGTLSVVLFLLGRSGLFRPELLVGITVALGVVGVATVRDPIRTWRRHRRTSRGALVGILIALTALALGLDLLGASAPPTSADALAYHVELPHYWLRIGRVDDPFWSFAAFYPLGVEMLFAQGLALAGGSAASAEHGILGVLAALATYGLARELGRGRSVAGVLGAALFVLQGTFTWDATSTFVELGLTFYAVLAAWLAVRYARQPSAAGAALAGLLCGAACAAKYVGLIAGAAVLAPLVLVTLRLRRLRDGLAALAAAVALGCCWYVRNWVVTGNPFYPLLFHGKLFTPYFAGYLKGSAQTYPGTHGADPLRILILPLDLLLHGDRFDRGQYVGTAIFVLAALGCWVLRKNRAAMVAAAAVAGYVFVWWYLIPQVRYLLPGLAVLAALAGAGLGDVLERPGRRRIAMALVLGVVCVAWAAPSYALERQLLPAAVGAQSQAENVDRLVGTYTALHEIEQQLGPRAVVGFVGYRWPFWYPGPSIWMGWPEFSPDVPSAELLKRLRRERVRDIVAWQRPPELVRMSRCLRLTGSYPARYVTSRSRGTGYPIRLDVYSARGCYR